MRCSVLYIDHTAMGGNNGTAQGQPKPQPAAEKKVGWVCKICGYVYEGKVLPPDFICPLCKHGAEDFEPLS